MSPALTRCLSAAASGFLKEFARAESITDGQGVGERATFELSSSSDDAAIHAACARMLLDLVRLVHVLDWSVKRFPIQIFEISFFEI